MTDQQQRTIEAAVDKAIEKAIEALPNGNDQQLTEWVEEHLPPFSRDIEEALAHEGLKDLIRERARKLCITLKGEVDEETLARHTREAIERYVSRDNSRR